MSEIKVHKSPFYIARNVRAVFPHLDEPDRYGSYSIDADVLANPELEATITEQVAAFLPKAQERCGTNKVPSNEFVRAGIYKEENFRRISFKMKSTRKVKGVEVKVRPGLVDAQKQPLTEKIWGGSLVNVMYYLQFTTTPTGTYMSVKLKNVQVIEHVGPGGEASGLDGFGEEEGFTTSGDETTAFTPAPPVDQVVGADF